LLNPIKISVTFSSGKTYKLNEGIVIFKKVFKEGF